MPVWVKVSERLPTKEDSVEFTAWCGTPWVYVLSVSGLTDIVDFEDVNSFKHTHWARIILPPLPPRELPPLPLTEDMLPCRVTLRNGEHWTLIEATSGVFWGKMRHCGATANWSKNGTPHSVNLASPRDEIVALGWLTAKELEALR